MTTAVKALLNLFDALSDDDKLAAVREVLRRMSASSPLELADESLVAAAAELFLELDAHEAADAGP